MISIIFTILTPLLILIGFLQVKRNGGFSVFNKRLLLKQQGIICHQCSFERELLPGTSYILSRKKPPRLCVAIHFFRQSPSHQVISWNFGDGTTSNQQDPLKVYTSPGVYNVSYVANTSSGVQTIQYSSSVLIGGFSPPASGAWLCKSCTRQSRIVEIDNSFKFISRRISEFLISKNFQKLGSFFIFSALFCVVLQIILYFFDIKVNLSVISNMILSIYWTLLILRQSIVFK